MLYELVTGRLAFAGETITDILSAIVSKEPDWGALPAETPESVRRVLRRCLTKDVKRRLRHIGDARLDLDDTTVSAQAAAPRGRRREYLAWTTAAVLLVALGCALAGLFGTGRSIVSDAPSVSRFVRLTSGAAHESAPAISPDGKWVAYLSNARGATDVWVKFIAGGDPVNLTAPLNLTLQTQSDIGGLAIAPDGTAIAFDAQVQGTSPPAYSSWVISAPLGGVPRKFVVNGRALRWSPDGTKIVYVVAGGSGGDSLWVADADGGNPREIAPRRGGIHKHWPTWSGDGRFVYFNNSISTSNVEPAELYRVPAAGGAIEPVVATARRAVFPALMPDGSGMMYGANPDTADLALWWKSLIRPDAAPERLTRGVDEYAEPYIAADGRSVVTTLVEVRQALLRLPAAGMGDTWSPASLTSGFTGDLDPVLSPAGDRLVFSSTRTGNRNLWTSRPDGTEVRPLTSGTSIDERQSRPMDSASRFSPIAVAVAESG